MVGIRDNYVYIFLDEYTYFCTVSHCVTSEYFILHAYFNAETMKRDAYNDDGPAQKRQRQTDDEITFLIPSKVSILLNLL